MAPIYAIEYIQNQAGKIRSMTGGQASMPFVLWQDGAGRSQGMAGQHTDVGMEALYAQLPGIKVVAPSDAYDAKGLKTARAMDVVVKNFHRDNAAVLAEWETARHVERAPRRKKPTPPEPPKSPTPKA